MQSAGVASGRVRPYVWRSVVLAGFGLLLCACQTSQTASTARPGTDATVAFESIDGPPPGVFKTLVQKLNTEAEARNVPVVSHAHAAPFRVRGYLALGIEKKKKRTVVSWVWDVYDAEQRRTVRFSGEEIGGPAGRDPWQAANDEVLGRVARAGMERLAAYFQVSPAAPAATPTAPPAGPAIADAAPADVPLPQRRADAPGAADEGSRIAAFVADR